MKIKVKRRGRKPFLKKIEKTKKYRAKGLTYREIAKLMNAHLNQIFRWCSYEWEEEEKKVLDKCSRI